MASDFSFVVIFNLLCGIALIKRLNDKMKNVYTIECKFNCLLLKSGSFAYEVPVQRAHITTHTSLHKHPYTLTVNPRAHTPAKRRTPHLPRLYRVYMHYILTRSRLST